MNYLIYVERAAENLQFFLWYKDYEKRFNAAEYSVTMIAPEWTDEQQEQAVQIARQEANAKKQANGVKDPTVKSLNFDISTTLPATEKKDPFATPPRTPAGNGKSMSSILPWEVNRTISDPASEYSPLQNDSYRQVANNTFAAAGLKAPCKKHACYISKSRR
jgi:hypothetical protein